MDTVRTLPATRIRTRAPQRCVPLLLFRVAPTGAALYESAYRK